MPGSTLTPEAILKAFSSPETLAAQAFPVLRSLAIHSSEDGYGPKSQDLLLRALEHRKSFEPYREILDSLTREFGLFPYLSPSHLEDADLIAYEFHRPARPRNLDIVFHRPQAQIYRDLSNRESVVLSAPTSFGKSLLIDAIVDQGLYDNILVVAPTLALIAETRRRLTKFAKHYSIITHQLQTPGERNIYILTQERAAALQDLGSIDFFVIDEFYKLDPTQRDTERSSILNHVFYQLVKLGKPFYLLGPSIESITSDLKSKVRCVFRHELYHTVASEVHQLDYTDAFEALATLCKTLHEPTLVFCRSPTRAAELANLLIPTRKKRTRKDVQLAADWIGAHFHPEWHFVRALRHGIGVHHGRIPRSLAQYAVRCFDSDRIGLLICTSTLIEGVNTKAKNVVVFDNKIANSKYDFFTFNNIRGRAGRMFRHFVGHVYLFHPAPEPTLPFVDIPAFSQSDGTPDSLLVQLDPEDLTTLSKERIRPLTRQHALSMETIRANIGVDPDSQIDLARTIRRTGDDVANLQWSRFPTKTQLYYVCELIWDHFNGPSLGSGSVRSAKQLAFLINRLRTKPTTRQLIESQLSHEKDPDKTVPAILDFLRLWANFHFPRLLRAVDLIQREVLTASGVKCGDYSHFASSVENYFHEPALVALEEYGLPLEIARKIEDYLRPKDGLDAVLDRLRTLRPSTLALEPFEIDVLDDVITSLG